MARIRTIKPDFWTDGAMVRLSPLARLLYIGMWNFTLCDHGHVADDATKLKLQILPMDNVDIEELLAEIMNEGRVIRVQDAQERTYLLVRRFEDHQKIDPRWKTRCPACAQQDSLQPIETQGSLPEPQGDSPTLILGRDGMGRDGKKTSSTAKPSKEFEEFWKSYPKKVGKGAGIKAHAKALRLADHKQIMDGVEALRIQVAGKDPQFTPNPATWLNEMRWEDETAEQASVVPAGYAWANR